jgi:hypothetical protein
MTAESLNNLLSAGKIVALPVDTWKRLADRFELLEDHKTGLAGRLLLTRGPTGFVVVEEPDPRRRTLRRFAEEKEARRFIRDRMETYDRMWDGCGCKVDYMK